jgi:hypothetical protein
MPLFRYFHRLPPLLRVVSIMGVLLPLASVAVLGPLLIVGWNAFPPNGAGYFRAMAIAMNGIVLALPCLFAVNLYCLRFVEPSRRAFTLRSWPRQVGVFVLLAALPLGGIAVALILPSALPASILEIGIAALGGIVFSVLHMAVIGTAFNHPTGDVPMRVLGPW